MAKLNNRAREVVPGVVTHEGGSGVIQSPEKELRRTMACLMLWEDTFYESGSEVANRVKDLVGRVSMRFLCDLAVEVRTQFKLRHAPLYLLCLALGKKGTAEERNLLGTTITQVIQRADELAEILAIYWREGRKPLPRQLKVGIANAFPKFSPYQLAKYNRDGAVKLRDALFLSHAKPKDEEQAKAWKKLVDGTLESPDTWEVQLSAGADKKETFTRLIKEEKLGYMALLRNLRNMADAGVDQELVKPRLLSGAEGSKALPFRFIAAARFAPSYASTLSEAMLRSVAKEEKLSGKTAIVVDVSGSMQAPLSSKSQMDRIDAAGGLAVLLKAITPQCRVFQFGTACAEVPNYDGLPLIDAIRKNDGGPTIRNRYGYAVVQTSNLYGNVGHGTNIPEAISRVEHLFPDVERVIVLTDMQSYGRVRSSGKYKGYYIDVTGYKVALPTQGGRWTILSGFSERLCDWIREEEKA